MSSIGRPLSSLLVSCPAPSCTFKDKASLLAPHIRGRHRNRTLASIKQENPALEGVLAIYKGHNVQKGEQAAVLIWSDDVKEMVKNAHNFFKTYKFSAQIAEMAKKDDIFDMTLEELEHRDYSAFTSGDAQTHITNLREYFEGNTKLKDAICPEETLKKLGTEQEESSDEAPKARKPRVPRQIIDSSSSEDDTPASKEEKKQQFRIISLKRAVHVMLGKLDAVSDNNPFKSASPQELMDALTAEKDKHSPETKEHNSFKKLITALNKKFPQTA